MEIFGRKLKIVENDNSNNCVKCALKDFCYPKDYPMPCKDANGNHNRHFEIDNAKEITAKKIIV